MPFSYLSQSEPQEPYSMYFTQPSQQEKQEHSPASSASSAQNISAMFGSMPATAGNVPLQMPNFVFGSQPTLAPGGGAEVLPAGFMAPPGSAWYNSSSPGLPSSIFTAFGWGDNAQQDEQQPSTAAFTQTPTTANAAESWDETSPTLPTPSTPSLLSNQISAFTSTGSALGLPVYSTSGFDLLGILARVVTRPNPKIMLGPVDMSCSFCVVDKRRYDSPIVYASPTFYKLTGYSEHEVIGRNCRFLQAPNGQVARGEPRQFVAADAVDYLKKSLMADKECQTSIVNYRKDGTAFINLVTVIPVTGGLTNSPDEQDDIVYQVGFQVDLTEQPHAILQKLRDGTYMVNYSANTQPSTAPNAQAGARDRRNKQYTLSVAQDLKDMLANPAFLGSALPPAAGLADDALTEFYDGNQPLSLVLLSALADGLLVLSLKGTFLYAAPALARLLGHDPHSLVNKSLTDFCHPSDVVPLTRDLKESSAPPSSSDAQAAAAAHSEAGIPIPRAPPAGVPRPVNLLFRARTASGAYVWLECRGRLHIEPGKGRKAIILSARPRPMPHLPLAALPPVSHLAEAWGLLSSTGTLLSVSQRVRDVVGRGVPEVVGKNLVELAGDELHARAAIEQGLQRARQLGARPQHLNLSFTTTSGANVNAVAIVHAAPPGAPMVMQLRAPGFEHAQGAESPQGDVFGELDAGAGESWQFALQQLKLENARLAQEVEALEAELPAPSLPVPISNRTQVQMPTTAAPQGMMSDVGSLREWNPPPPPVALHLPSKASLKRRWSGGGGET